MTKKNQIKSEQDFQLLSPKVKNRIKSLIEKRLNSQTIMLFAKEYEGYDFEFRETLIEYINYLMKIEREKWLIESNYLYGKHTGNALPNPKQIHFNETQENLKKFQNYLKTDINSALKKANDLEKQKKVIQRSEILKSFEVSNLNKAETQEPKIQQKKEVKKEKIINKELKSENIAKKEKKNQKKELSLLDKMLLEAKAREEKEAKEAKELIEKELKAKKLEEEKKLAEERRLAEEKKQEAIRKAELKKQKLLEKEQKIKEQKIKQKDENSKQMKSKTINLADIKPTNIKRDYEKEQAEKEKLWRELYGKARSESLKNRENDSLKTEKFVEFDKKPNFDPELDMQETFTILGNTFSMQEITDPKNKYFNFWYNLKKRTGTSNITVWLNTYPNKQKFILRKRLKYQENKGLWEKIKLIFGNNSSKLKVAQKQRTLKEEAKKKTEINKTK
ncbi:hypothetical protein [Spiroplasma floricola]|uniref:Uncharacterized protein n=1 Tax=Spiroplasma floricola 23-6 TaxID=1336749 RepID=A0A2K8SDY3_9MOLU|nr:hypothetical protein [Spiroplasma floricola]AUB31438.1 hypothetical protein SFLOR_v1c03810 [Spiroplasma floricola 23-6]